MTTRSSTSTRANDKHGRTKCMVAVGPTKAQNDEMCIQIASRSSQSCINSKLSQETQPAAPFIPDRLEMSAVLATNDQQKLQDRKMNTIP